MYKVDKPVCGGWWLVVFFKLNTHMRDRLLERNKLLELPSTIGNLRSLLEL